MQLLLEALGACCVSVPYLCDLLQAALARLIPPRSIAFIIKTNVFCHPFYPRMKAQIEITLLPALPWWAMLPGNGQQWGKRDGKGKWEPGAAPAFALWRLVALPQLPDPKHPNPKHPSLPTGFARQVGAHLKPLCSREGRWGKARG